MRFKLFFIATVFIFCVLINPVTAKNNSEIPGRDLTIAKLHFITTYIQKHNPAISYSDARRISEISYKIAAESDFSWTLIIAQLKQESHFRRFQVSSYNAMGMPQIVHHKWTWFPDYNKIITRPKDLFFLDKSIKAQILINNVFLSWEDGDLSRALDRYSGFAKNYSKTVLYNKRYLDSVISELDSLHAVDDCLIYNQNLNI